jgi:tyrocidine synthetase-3
VPLDIGFAAFELALDLYLLEDEIIGEFIYCTELFDRGSIVRLADDFAGLLRQVVGAPEGRLLGFKLPSEQKSAEPAAPESGIRSFRRRASSSS